MLARCQRYCQSKKDRRIVFTFCNKFYLLQSYTNARRTICQLSIFAFSFIFFINNIIQQLNVRVRKRGIWFFKASAGKGDFSYRMPPQPREKLPGRQFQPSLRQGCRIDGTPNPSKTLPHSVRKTLFSCSALKSKIPLTRPTPIPNSKYFCVNLFL